MGPGSPPVMQLGPQGPSGAPHTAPSCPCLPLPPRTAAWLAPLPHGLGLGHSDPAEMTIGPLGPLGREPMPQKAFPALPLQSPQWPLGSVDQSHHCCMSLTTRLLLDQEHHCSMWSESQQQRRAQCSPWRCLPSCCPKVVPVWQTEVWHRPGERPQQLRHTA